MQRKYFNTDLIIERNLETRELARPTQERELPWVIQAKDNPTIDFLFNFIKQEKSRLRDVLLKHGAILLRGFNVENHHHFANIMHTFGVNLANSYALGGAKRTKFSEYVFNTTDAAYKHPIGGHTEMSYLENRPRFIAFYCSIEPPICGETPIFNCRTTYRTLSEKTKNLLRNKEIRYFRTVYTKGKRYNPKSLKEVFETDDTKQIEALLKTNNIAYQWRQDGLRMELIESPLVKCPETHEICVNVLSASHWSFFIKEIKNMRSRQNLIVNYSQRLSAFLNAIFFKLEKKVVDLENKEVINTNHYYKSIAHDLHRAKWQHGVIFKWQQGDVLMLDNMLTAHGRMNVIPPREIKVCFGDMYNRKQYAA